VLEEGNEDGRFTTISLTQNIPVILFEKNMALGDVLQNLFRK